MRLLTFNCNGSDYGRCADALASYEADILVLTELIELRNQAEGRAIWSGPRVTNGRRKKGVGVIVRPGLQVLQLDSRDNPSYILARVEGPGSPVFVTGLWTRRPYRENALTALAEARATLGDHEHVVAGDLNDNLYPRWRHDHSLDFRTTRRVLEVEHGLVSAYHAFTGEAFAEETAPTLYFQRQRSRPYHIDFVFVPKTWQARLVKVSVPGYEVHASLSDHRPVVVDLADPLPASDSP